MISMKKLHITVNILRESEIRSAKTSFGVFSKFYFL